MARDDHIRVFEFRREDIDAALGGIPNVNVLADFLAIAVPGNFRFANALFQDEVDPICFIATRPV